MYLNDYKVFLNRVKIGENRKFLYELYTNFKITRFELYHQALTTNRLPKKELAPVRFTFDSPYQASRFIFLLANPSLKVIGRAIIMG